MFKDFFYSPNQDHHPYISLKSEFLNESNGGYGDIWEGVEESVRI